MVFVFNAFTLFPVIHLTNIHFGLARLVGFSSNLCQTSVLTGALGAGGSGVAGGAVMGSMLAAASGTELQKPEAEEKHVLPTVWYSLVYSNETRFILDFHFDISSNRQTKDTAEHSFSVLGWHAIYYLTEIMSLC